MERRQSRITRKSFQQIITIDSFIVISERAVGLQLHNFDTMVERFVRGFQHAHDTQARFSAIEGLLIIEDAIDEITRLKLESFDLLDLRRPHIAGTITD